MTSRHVLHYWLESRLAEINSLFWVQMGRIKDKYPKTALDLQYFRNISECLIMQLNMTESQ